MKKIAVIATALTLVLSTAAMAQSNGGSPAGQGAGSASGDKASPGAPNGSPSGTEGQGGK